MRSVQTSQNKTKTFAFAFALLAVSSLAQAQDSQNAPPPPDNGQQQSEPGTGWRRFGNQDPGQQPPNQGPQGPYQGQQPRYQSQQPPYQDQQPRYQGQQPPYQGQNDRPDYRRDAPPPVAIPPQLTIKPGTFLTVRVNQRLSSDHNQPGDAFTATLVRPLVVDGVVVADRGETIAGRVTEAKKAGRVEGLSHLKVQLTDLTLVDGQQLPIQSQMLTRNGQTSFGRDAGAIGGTTVAGAAVGAAVNGGVGAGVGAAAGLVVGTVGVLLTRGRPTEIYPESVLTFRVEAPVVISTERSQQAFRYVEPNEYDRPYNGDGPPERRIVAGCAGYGCAPQPAYYGGYYGYYPGYYPYYYGPSLGFYFGGRGGWGRGYYGGGRAYFRGSFHR